MEIEKLEERFQDTWLKIAKHYDLKTETEYHKLEVLMKIHEYFLSSKVAKDAKPVITVRDVGFW